MTRLTSFSGVKEEEHLLVAAVPLEGETSFDDRMVKALLASVRKSGDDWPTVAVDVPPDAGVSAAEQSEEMLKDRYKAIKDEKWGENRDGADLLSQLLDDHLRKKREGFREADQ
jgi:hypothetical protein